MDDLLGMTRPDGGSGTAIDAAVLERILNIGDARLRVALLDQLLADFRRIAATLGEDGAEDICAAAHELKGLAATIGAHRLARLARQLNTVADSAVPVELGDFRAPVQGEIGMVLDSLAIYADRVRS